MEFFDTRAQQLTSNCLTCKFSCITFTDGWKLRRVGGGGISQSRT